MRRHHGATSQMHLPTQYGGIGLRPMEIVSVAAWLASIAASAPDILAVMERPEFGDAGILPPARLIQEYCFSRVKLIELAPQMENAVFTNGSAIDGLKLKLLPLTLLEFLRLIQQHPVIAKKLQRTLLEPVWEAKVNTLKEFYANSPSDLRRINALLSEVGVAGRIWTIIPTSDEKRMSDALIQQTLRLQLGALPAEWMYLVEDEFNCPTCKRSVSVRDAPSHSNHCAANMRTVLTNRHDGVCDIFCWAARQGNVAYVWEETLDGGKKPDVSFIFPGHTIVTDVTIVAPEAPSKDGDGEDDPLKMAHRQEKAKMTKYAELVASVGNVFVPLAFLTSGAFTLQTALFIKRLCAAGHENGAANPVEPAELRDRIAVAIQRGNAMANILTAARLRASLPAFAVARPKLADLAAQRARATRRRNFSYLAAVVGGKFAAPA